MLKEPGFKKIAKVSPGTRTLLARQMLQYKPEQPLEEAPLTKLQKELEVLKTEVKFQFNLAKTKETMNKTTMYALCNDIIRQDRKIDALMAKNKYLTSQLRIMREKVRNVYEKMGLTADTEEDKHPYGDLEGESDLEEFHEECDSDTEFILLSDSDNDNQAEDGPSSTTNKPGGK